MHSMSPMVAVTQEFPIAVEIFPTDVEGLSPPYTPQIILITAVQRRRYSLDD